MRNDLKTTISAIVGILVFILARYGIEVPPDVQISIALATLGIIAFFAGDRQPPTRPPRLPKRAVKALALVLILSVTLTACTKSQVQKTYNAANQIVDKLKVNANLPQVLLDEGVITQEQFEKLKRNFNDAIAIATQFRDDLEFALQSTDPARLANLVPVLANLIATVNVLKFEGIEKFKKLSKVLSHIEGLLRVIAVFFSQTIQSVKSDKKMRSFIERLHEGDVRLINEFAEAAE